MNAVLKETPKDAARRLAAGAIRDGFKPETLHEYQHADGSPIYWRIRCVRADGEKWIRPMHWNGAAYVAGEPPAPAVGKPLYRLPELAAAPDDAVVVVAEGEKCADALAKLGMTATTSGSASSANAADWTPLRHRSVLLWPDHDEPGAGYARDVAAKLRTIGCIVEMIDAAALDLPEHGDCVDWFAQHPDATPNDVLVLSRADLPASVHPASSARTEPEPLRRPVPPPEPYPTAELGPILAPACESLRRVIQAPDAVCGSSLLAAASLATQALANVEREPGAEYPLSLWMLTIANSGERKSAVDSEAMRAARNYEKELAKAYETEQATHAALLAEWEAKCNAAKTTTKKTGEGLAKLLQELGPAPPAPLTPRVTVADFTAEGLAKLLAAGFPSVGAFTDEAALVFGGHGMTKETVTRTAGTLSKLWDSGTLDRVRATEGATKLYGRRLAMHLLAQPVIAERALSDDVLSGQGFLARCLLAWPESMAGARPYCAESLRDDAALIQFVARLGALHREPLPLAQGEREELAPRILRMAAAAKASWVAFHNGIEAGMKPGGRFATVQAWASKTPEQALRIAGVLALLDNVNAQEIDQTTIERAAELALWHLNEAARLAGTAELSQEVRDAEALLDWAHATGRTLLYSRAALQFGPTRIRERERFVIAMAELERAGWANPIDGGAEVDGKHRRHVWRIAPKARE